MSIPYITVKHLYFQQHSRYLRLSTCFFKYIPASSGSFPELSFVFIDIRASFLEFCSCYVPSFAEESDTVSFPMAYQSSSLQITIRSVHPTPGALLPTNHSSLSFSVCQAKKSWRKTRAGVSTMGSNHKNSGTYSLPT